MIAHSPPGPTDGPSQAAPGRAEPAGVLRVTKEESLRTVAEFLAVPNSGAFLIAGGGPGTSSDIATSPDMAVLQWEGAASGGMGPAGHAVVSMPRGLASRYRLNATHTRKLCELVSSSQGAESAFLGVLKASLVNLDEDEGAGGLAGLGGEWEVRPGVLAFAPLVHAFLSQPCLLPLYPPIVETDDRMVTSLGDVKELGNWVVEAAKKALTAAGPHAEVPGGMGGQQVRTRVRRLFLCRHGERADEADGAWVQTAQVPEDPPLTDRGKEQVSASGSPSVVPSLQD
jgi:hypothetical protein